jgi:hypothetical protein
VPAARPRRVLRDVLRAGRPGGVAAVRPRRGLHRDLHEREPARVRARAPSPPARDAHRRGRAAREGVPGRLSPLLRRRRRRVRPGRRRRDPGRPCAWASLERSPADRRAVRRGAPAGDPRRGVLARAAASVCGDRRPRERRLSVPLRLLHGLGYRLPRAAGGPRRGRPRVRVVHPAARQGRVPRSQLRGPVRRRRRTARADAAHVHDRELALRPARRPDPAAPRHGVLVRRGRGRVVGGLLEQDRRRRFRRAEARARARALRAPRRARARRAGELHLRGRRGPRRRPRRAHAGVHSGARRASGRTSRSRRRSAPRRCTIRIGARDGSSRRCRSSSTIHPTS